ncbi:MAG: glutamate--tRNA ligase [SAR324 cluster bacterium]|nr:glutamate--tRNA ligase [SAR324 cluster bacterium]
MVRLRFAPSPTGYLHVGGLRTALFSYLFAKQQGGAFIFRLEDTDQQRLVEGSEDNLLEMMHWAGLQMDEGPGIGGEFGPYRQSERLPIYHQYSQQLLDAGHAYHCFCTPEILEEMRNAQKAKGEAPRYDGRCRHLAADEVQQKLSGKAGHVIRMKIPENETVLMSDLIRGTVAIETSQLDDQVLIKADGFPTYHLAVVVDDHLMEISHVVRGEEWLPSFPKHVLLFRYFNWEAPKFAHLPLILNPDRSKLSKRQGDVAVEDYRQQGYLPQALVNFIALLGWNTSDDQEIFSMEELIEKFSFDRIGKSGAVFDREKLNWMNQQYLKDLNSGDLFELLAPYIAETPYRDEENSQLRKVSEVVQSRLTTLADIKSKLALFFEDKPTLNDAHLIEVLHEESSRIVLNEFKQQAGKAEEMTVESFLALMKSVQKATGIKGKNLWMPMRFAITLEEHGPELPQVAAIFGKEKCLRMIDQALES